MNLHSNANPSNRFLSVALLLLLLTSCEGDIYVAYKFTGIEINHITTSTGIPEVSSESEISGKVYGIRMDLFPVETERGRGRYVDMHEEQPHLMNPIKHIFITSDRSFDEYHPAGSLLNGYFRYYPGSYMQTVALKDSTMFDVTGWYLPTYPESVLPEVIDLLLMREEVYAYPRKFFIRLTFQDGTEYRDSTSVVTLQ